MTPRDPIREALVSARTRAWMAYIDAPMPSNAQEDHDLARLESAWQSAHDAVIEYDARTTPAASSDAGALDTPLTENRHDERTD